MLQEFLHALGGNLISSEIQKIQKYPLLFPSDPGPISSVLVNTYGCRPIVMIGGCLCSLGMILASFCSSVLQLYLCIGVIGGESLEPPIPPHSDKSIGLNLKEQVSIKIKPLLFSVCGVFHLLFSKYALFVP